MKCPRCGIGQASVTKWHWVQRIPFKPSREVYTGLCDACLVEVRDEPIRTVTHRSRKGHTYRQQTRRHVYV